MERGPNAAPKATGLTVERHYTGGLQCLIMHRRRVKGTLFAVQEVWVAATTHNRRETACLYAALQLHETEAAPIV